MQRYSFCVATERGEVRDPVGILFADPDAAVAFGRRLAAGVAKRRHSRDCVHRIHVIGPQGGILATITATAGPVQIKTRSRRRRPSLPVQPRLTVSELNP